MTVSWHPQRLRSSLIAALHPAATDFQRLAASASPSRRVAAAMFTRSFGTRATVGSKHPLSVLLQKGARPHLIGEAGEELHIGSNVVEGPIRHPGFQGNPFLRRLLPGWPALYRRRARAMSRV